MALLERYAVDLQRRIIASGNLTRGLGRVRVLATVHTDLEKFINSQPQTTADCERPTEPAWC